MELSQEIIKAFQAISLILIFITMLFTMRYKAIIDMINEDIPVGPKDRMRKKRELKIGFLSCCFPIITLSGVSFYILFPLSIEIISKYRFSIWNFKLLPTSYIFIVIWIGFIFFWSFALGFKLVKKIQSIRTID